MVILFVTCTFSWPQLHCSMFLIRLLWPLFCVLLLPCSILRTLHGIFAVVVCLRSEFFCEYNLYYTKQKFSTSAQYYSPRTSIVNRRYIMYYYTRLLVDECHDHIVMGFLESNISAYTVYSCCHI